MSYKTTLVASFLLVQFFSLQSSASLFWKSPLTYEGARVEIKVPGQPAQIIVPQSGSPEDQCVEAQKAEIEKVGTVIDKLQGNHLFVRVTKTVSDVNNTSPAQNFKVIASPAGRPELFDEFDMGSRINAALYIEMSEAGECKVVTAKQLTNFYANVPKGFDVETQNMGDDYNEHCDCAR